MLKNIEKVSTGYRSCYTDKADKTVEVRHSVVLNADRQSEETIVDELCKVFSHKTD